MALHTLLVLVILSVALQLHLKVYLSCCHLHCQWLLLLELGLQENRYVKTEIHFV